MIFMESLVCRAWRFHKIHVHTIPFEGSAGSRDGFLRARACSELGS
jgi:hypothetical protein